MDSASSCDDGDDDIYVSSAARLKRLKKKAPIEVQDSPIVVNEEEETDYWSSKSPVPLNTSIEFTSPPAKASPQRSSRRKSRGKKVPDQELEITSIEIVDDDDEKVVPSKHDSTFDSPNCTSDLNIEDDNYSVDIKIKWRSRTTFRRELKKYESFQKIFQYFAELEGVSENQILILRNNKQIRSGDTPASLDLKVIDILEGGIVNAPVVSEEQVEDTENLCKIKVQMSTKQKIFVDLKMDETFKRVVHTCAQELNVPSSQIKLSFDGDEISLTDTPESLDLEREACIDLRVVAS